MRTSFTMNTSKPTHYLSIAILSSAVILIQGRTEEYKLLSNLFPPGSNFQKILPKRTFKEGKPLRVQLVLLLHNVESVKPEQEEIDLTLWFLLDWESEILRWNETETEIRSLVVDPSVIWTPALFIAEALEGSIIENTEAGSAVLRYDGYTNYHFFKSFKIRCAMNSCFFPFEAHTCTMAVTMPDHTTDKAILQNIPNMDRNIPIFKGTGTWDIRLQHVQDGKRIYSPHLKRNVSYCEYELRLSRKPQVYVIILFVPAIVTSSVALSAFQLPLTHGRISLILSLLLTIIFSMDSIMKYIPRSSDYVPLVGSWIVFMISYLVIEIWLSSLSWKFLTKMKCCKDTAKKVVEHPLQTTNSSSGNLTKSTNVVTPEDRSMYSSSSVDDSDLKSQELETTEGSVGTIMEKKDFASTCKRRVIWINRLSFLISISISLFLPLSFFLMFARILPSNC